MRSNQQTTSFALWQLGVLSLAPNTTILFGVISRFDTHLFMVATALWWKLDRMEGEMRCISRCGSLQQKYSWITPTSSLKKLGRFGISSLEIRAMVTVGLRKSWNTGQRWKVGFMGQIETLRRRSVKGYYLSEALLFDSRIKMEQISIRFSGRGC